MEFEMQKSFQSICLDSHCYCCMKCSHLETFAANTCLLTPKISCGFPVPFCLLVLKSIFSFLLPLQQHVWRGVDVVASLLKRNVSKCKQFLRKRQGLLWKTWESHSPWELSKRGTKHRRSRERRRESEDLDSCPSVSQSPPVPF